MAGPKQPRGRAPKGKRWDESAGAWVPVETTEGLLKETWAHMQQLQWGAHQLQLQWGPTTTVLEGNQSCIAVAESEMQTKRQAHIPRRYFKVRELIQGQDPEIKLQYVTSADNYADCCTKNLGPEILSGIRGHILVRRSDVG